MVKRDEKKKEIANSHKLNKIPWDERVSSRDVADENAKESASFRFQNNGTRKKVSVEHPFLRAGSMSGALDETLSDDRWFSLIYILIVNIIIQVSIAGGETLTSGRTLSVFI